MQKNSEDFSIQEAMRLAKSPAGQQLLAMLQHADTGELQKAMSEASAGNYEQAKQTMSHLMSSPEIQELLKKMGG